MDTERAGKVRVSGVISGLSFGAVFTFSQRRQARPPSPPHRWDQYSVSTKYPQERGVSQSALTELKASSCGQRLRKEADVEAGQSAP